MSKTNYGSSRVQSNLLQQNCFVRDVVRKVDLKSENSDSCFISLDEVLSENGVSFVPRKYPYPITPHYVNSFVDSADYRRDPVSAINNGVKRQNLGDISQIQSVLSMDSSLQRSLYEQLSAKFSKSVDPNKPNNPVDPKPVDPKSVDPKE